MAPHSSTLAWKIPWMEEPGRLQSMGLLRVGHDWVTSVSLFTFMHWRRKWQPTPVFLPGESQGRGILVGCRLWGRTESDTTEVTQQQLSSSHFLIGLFAFFNRVVWAIYIVCILTLCWSHYLQIFSDILCVGCLFIDGIFFCTKAFKFN